MPGISTMIPSGAIQNIARHGERIARLEAQLTKLIAENEKRLAQIEEVVAAMAGEVATAVSKTFTEDDKKRILAEWEASDDRGALYANYGINSAHIRHWKKAFNG